MTNGKETIEFKTEVNQILDLMIHSLYSHKEIFLRELISNSSDAIDKVKFESITNDKLLEKTGGEFKIKIIPNKDKNTLTIIDNGIGMNHDEIISNIGTIAKSGTKEFTEKIKNSKDTEQTELIGQFGVGFYSAFMVASKVEVITRKAGEDKAHRWISEGKGNFTLEEAEKETSGTDVVLHIKEEEKEFLNTWRIKEIVKKHSDFISHPIVMDIERSKIGEDKKEEKVIEEETLNSQKALWLKKKNEIKEEEYDDFYKHLTHNFESPLFHIHQHLEGTMEFKSLLYIPKKVMTDLYNPEAKYGVNLYIKRVFIMDNCEALLPSYLRFVKGVIDSSDLPLNISRQNIQEHPLLDKIKSHITKKVLSSLSDLKEKEPEKYLEFYKAFGKVLKEGLHADFTNREALQELLLFESTSTKNGEFVSLKEYFERMPKSQEAIYFITGESRQIVENSPVLEAFKKKGYEVLFLLDPIDEWIIPSIYEYNKKSLKSIAKGDIKFEETEDEKKKIEKETKDFSSLIELIKMSLNDDVKEVKISKRLVDSPCCLVMDEQGVSSRMEKILSSMNQNIPKVKPTLEINVDHPILKKMKKVFKDSPKSKKLEDYSKLLYNQALLAEGEEVKDVSFFLKKMNELMVEGLE